MSMFDMMPFERRNSMARFDPFRELDTLRSPSSAILAGASARTLRTRATTSSWRPTCPG